MTSASTSLTPLLRRLTEVPHNPLTFPGPLASVMGLEGTGFISTSYNNISYGQDWPDLQLLFFPQTISTDGKYEALIYGLSYKVRECVDD